MAKFSYKHQQGKDHHQTAKFKIINVCWFCFFSEVKKRLIVWEKFCKRRKPGENERSYKRKKSTDLRFQLVRRKLTSFSRSFVSVNLSTEEFSRQKKETE